MNGLRKRMPFKLPLENANEEDEVEIMDDQEQETLIRTLQDANAASNRLYLLALQITLSLSGLLQILYLRQPSKTGLLHALFPSAESDPPIPLATPFALLSLLVHIGLALLIHPDLFPDIIVAPLAYFVLLAISTIAPVLCIMLGRTWQTVIWWSLTPSVVLLVQSVLGWIDDGNNSIRELEKLKYVARGA